MEKPLQKIFFLTPILLCLLFALPISTRAQTVDELQKKINTRTEDIRNLEAQIKNYQVQINALGSQANSLSVTIKSLDLTQKKLTADIQITENKIESKNYEILQLEHAIDGKQDNISDNRRVISHSFLSMGQADTQSVQTIVLGSKSISEALGTLDELGTLQNGIQTRIAQLKKDKDGLQINKTATERAKADLVLLNNQLKAQKAVVLQNVAVKNQLLKETRQSESEYKSMLEKNKKLKEEFEREILDFESKIRIAIDFSKLPHYGSGVLFWPLDLITITQYFGNTSFAKANPQIYKSGHPGVDFRASIGTQVKASLNGVVSATENDYVSTKCYPYGRWILIKHPNGLSTLYAHLATVNVTVGQSVSTGQVIGYSGYSGYVDPPGPRGAHLHFGVYATEGIRVISYSELTKNGSCQSALYPSSPSNAKLNPLSYL